MGSWCELESSDGHRLAAWRSDPAHAPLGAIVLIQEIFGVNAHVRGVADRYAEAGYVVLAPALLDRAERGVELGYDEAGVARGRELVAKVGFDGALRDVAAAAAALEGAGDVAAIGFCWGGTVALLANTRLGLPAVSYYGGRSQPFLHERSRAPLQLHFGARDPIIPPDHAERIRAAHPDADSYTYDAGHGFNCEARADYDAASSRTALDRTLAFLRTHLAPGAEQGFELDPRLTDGARVVAELPLCRVLLVDEARFPWLILVPRRAACRDLIDLVPHAQRRALVEVERAARALRATTRCEKLNIASLGNQVAQLHVHVIARHADDAAWPRPIWGVGDRVPYPEKEIDRLLERLREAL